MTREEEIIKQSISYTLQVCPACISGDNPFNEEVRDLNRNKAFEAGAKWADNNLKNVWYDVNEIPNQYQWIICELYDEDPDPSYEVFFSAGLDLMAWERKITMKDVIRWAYISDLLPKGGEE